MQTRGSSRAGQLQCGLRRRGVGSSRRAGRSRQAQAGGVPRIVLAEGKKINLAVGAQWHSEKKEKKGRFGVGAGLRGQTLDRPPILRGSVGPVWAFLLTVKLLGFLVNSETRHTEGANNQISE